MKVVRSLLVKIGRGIWNSRELLGERQQCIAGGRSLRRAREAVAQREQRIERNQALIVQNRANAFGQFPCGCAGLRNLSGEDRRSSRRFHPAGPADCRWRRAGGAPARCVRHRRAGRTRRNVRRA